MSARSLLSLKNNTVKTRHQPGTARNSEVFIHGWIRLKNRIELRLKLPLLVGRRAFLDQKEPADDAAVAGRQQE